MSNDIRLTIPQDCEENVHSGTPSSSLSASSQSPSSSSQSSPSLPPPPPPSSSSSPSIQNNSTSASTWSTENSPEFDFKATSQVSHSLRQFVFKVSRIQGYSEIKKLTRNKNKKNTSCLSQLVKPTFISWKLTEPAKSAPIYMKNMLIGIKELPRRIIAIDGFKPNSTYGQILKRFRRYTIERENYMKQANHELDTLAIRYLSESDTTIPFMKHVEKIAGAHAARSELRRMRKEELMQKKAGNRLILPKLTTQTPDMLLMMEDECGEVLLEIESRIEQNTRQSAIKNTKNMVKRMVMKKIKEKISSKKRDRDELMSQISGFTPKSIATVESASTFTKMGSEEMELCLKKLSDFFQDVHVVAVQIGLAMHGNNLKSQRMLLNVLGTQTTLDDFTGTLMSNEWLFKYLQMVFGNATEVMSAFDAYEDPGSTNPKMENLSLKLEGAIRDTEVIEEFVTTMQSMMKELVLQLQTEDGVTETSEKLVRKCMEENDDAIELLSSEPGLDNQLTISILEAIKKVDKDIFYTLLKEVERRKKPKLPSIVVKEVEPVEVEIVSSPSTSYSSETMEVLPRSLHGHSILYNKELSEFEATNLSESPENMVFIELGDDGIDGDEVSDDESYDKVKRLTFTDDDTMASSQFKTLQSSSTRVSSIHTTPIFTRKARFQQRVRKPKKLEKTLSSSMDLNSKRMSITLSFVQESPDSDLESDDRVQQTIHDLNDFMIQDSGSSTSEGSYDANTVYLISQRSFSLSEIIDTSSKKISEKKLTKDVALLLDIIGKPWFPDQDINLEPNRIILTIAKTLLSLSITTCIGAIADISRIKQKFILVEGVRMACVYYILELFHKCIMAINGSDMSKGAKETFINLSEKIIKVLLEFQINVTDYQNALTMMKKKKKITKTEFKMQKPRPPKVPDVDLQKTLEHGKLANDTFMATLGVDGRFMSGSKYWKNRMAKIETETKALAQLSNVFVASSETALSSRHDSVLNKTKRHSQWTLDSFHPIGPIHGRKLGVNAPRSKLIRTNEPAMSKTMLTVLPTLKSFLNVNVFKQLSLGQMANTADLIKFLETSDNDEEKDVLIAACEDILKMDNASLMDIRNWMLNNMDTVASKVGRNPHVTPTMNFLSIFQNGLMKEETEDKLDVDMLVAKENIKNMLQSYIASAANGLKREMSLTKKMNALQRMIWMTLPETYNWKLFFYNNLADILVDTEILPADQSLIIQNALQDIIDLLYMLQVHPRLGDKRLGFAFDILLASIEVLEWFQIETSSFVKQIQNFPENLEKCNPFHPKVRPSITSKHSAIINLSNEYFSLLPIKLQQTIVTSKQPAGSSSQLPLVYLFSKYEKFRFDEVEPMKIKATELQLITHLRSLVAINEKDFSGNLKDLRESYLWSNKSPTEIKAMKVSKQLDLSDLIENNTNPVDRSVLLILPEVEENERYMAKKIGELIKADALPSNIRSRYLRHLLENMCDAMVLVEDKKNISRNDRQSAYNRILLSIDSLRWLNIPNPPFVENLEKHTDLMDKYEPIFTPDEAPNSDGQMGINSKIFLSENYLKQLPHEFVKKLKDFIQVTSSKRTTLAEYIHNVDQTIFSEISEMDMERRRLKMTQKLWLKYIDFRKETMQMEVKMSMSKLVSSVTGKLAGVLMTAPGEKSSSSSTFTCTEDDSKKKKKIQIENRDSLSINDSFIFADSSSTSWNVSSKSSSYTFSDPVVRKTQLTTMQPDESAQKSVNSLSGLLHLYKILKPDIRKSDIFFGVESNEKMSIRETTTETRFVDPIKQSTQEHKPKKNENQIPISSESMATSDEVTLRATKLKKSIIIPFDKAASSDSIEFSSSSSPRNSSTKAVSFDQSIATLTELIGTNTKMKQFISPSEKHQDEHQDDYGASEAIVKRRRIKRAVIKKLKENDYRGMQAYRNVIPETIHHTQSTIGDRNRALKDQMRINMMLQYLRNNMEAVEVAAVYADLNTEHPSRKTELLLKSAAAYIDKEKNMKLISATQGFTVTRPTYISNPDWCRLGIRGGQTRISLKMYPNNPRIRVHCPNEMISKLKASDFGLNPSRLLTRADTIGYISKALQEKAYSRIKSTMITCLQNIKNDEQK